MTQPVTISADYTLRPSQLASVLALLAEARQPTIVWGPPGAAKSMIAQHAQVEPASPTPATGWYARHRHTPQL